MFFYKLRNVENNENFRLEITSYLNHTVFIHIACYSILFINSPTIISLLTIDLSSFQLFSHKCLFQTNFLLSSPSHSLLNIILLLFHVFGKHINSSGNVQNINSIIFLFSQKSSSASSSSLILLLFTLIMGYKSEENSFSITLCCLKSNLKSYSSNKRRLEWRRRRRICCWGYREKKRRNPLIQSRCHIYATFLRHH